MNQILVAKSFFDASQGLGATDRARALDLLAKLHDDPRQPGLHLEKVQSGGPGFHSARISQGVRAILHIDGSRFVLLYAGEHDVAYEWARGRRLEPHKVTGELQIVESVERTEDMLTEPASERAAAQPSVLPRERFADDYLLSLGVPPDWLPVLRHVTDEGQLLEVASKLPQEVGERLLTLAAGEVVTPPSPVSAAGGVARPLTSDEQRRFLVVGDSELADILEKPLDAWVRFLHPTQRALATGTFAGPVKVTGSAGTGKSVVGIHRVRHLASEGQCVLLTSFVTTLCRNLERNLKVLLRAEEISHVTVSTVHAQALAVLGRAGEKVEPIRDEEIGALIEAARGRTASDGDPDLLEAEWRAVIDAQGLATWDDYRDAERRGRGRPLSIKDRKEIWKVVEQLRADLVVSGRDTFRGICMRAQRHLSEGRVRSAFDAIVVDEVQDLQAIEIRFLAALASCGEGAPNLMLLGDAGQRIYPGGFSLRALGVDVRGRSKVLRINYRTTDQIRRAADRILDPACDDLDESLERRDGTRSLLRGPDPVLRGFTSTKSEAEWIVERIAALCSRGCVPQDFAVFTRAGAALEAVRRELAAAAIPASDLSKTEAEATPGVSLGTMHRAKGLEFKIVFAAGCSGDQLPTRAAQRKTADSADREAALARERSLLYVSLTRARDEAFVTWVGEPSPFLAPLLSEGAARTTESNA